MRGTRAIDRHFTAGTKARNDTGWIELKALIRKAVHAVSQRATAESFSMSTSAADTVVILTVPGNNIFESSPNQASRLAHWFADGRDTKGYLDE